MRPFLHAILPIALIAPAAFGQTPLQPLWLHTWPFGSGDPQSILPPGNDNHVAVDPMNGTVYVSIDDQYQTFSERWELLYSFSPEGTEITPDPVPLLGTWPQSEYPEWNEEGTRHLAVYDGSIVEHHQHYSLTGSVAHRSVKRSGADGSSWQGSVGAVFNGASLGDPVVDEEGLVMCGSADGVTGWLGTVDPTGWPKWARSFPTMSYTTGTVVIDGTIFAGAAGSVFAVDRATGELLDQIVLTPNTAHVVLATDGTDIYYLWSYMSNTHWGKCTVNGDPIWDQQMADFLWPARLDVDGLGRLWSNMTEWYEGGLASRLFVTSADGSAYEEFTYGASIADIAIDGDQAYLTGWSDTTTTETYLIAVSTDMNVGRPESATRASIMLRPVPASDVLSVDCTLDILVVEVVDATGRTVLRQAPTTHLLNVSALAPGSYSLRAHTKTGTVQQRFSVAR